MPERRLRMAACMVGSPAGTMSVVVVLPLGRVGGERVAVGGLGVLPVFGSGVASIRTWDAELAAPVLKTSWWHGGDAE